MRNAKNKGNIDYLLDEYLEQKESVTARKEFEIAALDVCFSNFKSTHELSIMTARLTSNKASRNRDSDLYERSRIGVLEKRCLHLNNTDSENP